MSRVFWIFMVVLALVAGTLFQARDLVFAWAGDTAVEAHVERAIETRVEDAVESSIERLEVVGAEGRAVEIAPQTRRELGEAVRRLAAAEADLAILRIGDSSDAAAQEARGRRDAAKADVERLSAEIERQDELSAPDRDLMRQQIQQEVRSSIRETIRSAVRG